LCISDVTSRLSFRAFFLFIVFSLAAVSSYSVRLSLIGLKCGYRVDLEERYDERLWCKGGIG